MYRTIIVDDEQSAKRSLRKIIEMEQLPFDVISEADNGREALLQVQELAPDLVITDIRMPVMDGLALCSRIREQDLQVEIVMISGFSQFEYAQQAIRYGVADFLLKPIDSDQVAGTLKRIGEKLDARKQGIKQKNRLVSIVKSRLKPIVKLMWAVNEAAVLDELEQMKPELKACGLSPSKLHELCIEFIALIHAELTEISPEWFCPQALEDMHFVLAYDRIFENLKQEILSLMEKIRCHRNWASYNNITKAVDYIKTHYTDEHFSLKEAAEIAGMSTTYFSKSFKDEIGVSYTEFISGLRMKRAIELLEDPYNKVYEVAYAIGYANYAHFAKVFKKNYGCSPTDFRNNQEVG